eukprot:4726410-Pleurochrysis_carterae.AAC.3
MIATQQECVRAVRASHATAAQCAALHESQRTPRTAGRAARERRLACTAPWRTLHPARGRASRAPGPRSTGRASIAPNKKRRAHR